MRSGDVRMRGGLGVDVFRSSFVECAPLGRVGFNLGLSLLALVPAAYSKLDNV